ncbi:MAG TPA: tetratricopeptide repeat protein [Bryobacteraceae bacterium]|jgi:tetratricopeptide (TPR) repeat protein|nr:tetratricopeptide repeat protein [Bryobacteraceae bacterium]
MKAKKRAVSTAQVSSKTAPPPARISVWAYIIGAFVVFCVALQAYAPSWNGPFLFDDAYLPFYAPNFPPDLRVWVSGVRPLLMLTYWINFRFSELSTPSYHFGNVLIHTAGAFLAFLVLKKILEMARVEQPLSRILALFGAAVFLLHPVQTESVAYVASRSESLSGMFFLAAVTAYLYRGTEAISWGRALATMLLAAAALASKEHMLILPAFLLLTDYFWNPGFSWKGAARNWRFYGPVAVGGLAGAAFVWNILEHSRSAGFSLQDFTWYQYFFTECRALFVYLRLFVLPIGQTVDYDFPISYTIWQHGAIAGILALAAVTGAAWYFRKRYPLASYGWFMFLLMMAPTSSVVPIKDPVAERRIYLAILGLLLMVMEALRRVRISRAALAAGLTGVVLLLGILTYQRNQIWGDPIALWSDTVEKSPQKSRAHFQLAFAYYQQGACGKALEEYARTAQLQPPAYDLLVDWGQAYDCQGNLDEALAKFQQAAAINRTAHVYSQIGMAYAKQSKWPEALEALKTAESIDPNYGMTYYYRAGVHMKTGEVAAAVEEYRKAVMLDPQNKAAAEALATAERLLPRVR